MPSEPRRRDDPQHLAAVLFRDRPCAGGHDQRRGRARQGNANQRPRQDQHGGTIGRRHQQKPGNVDHRAGEHRDAQPEPIGERPDRGLRQAPDDILDRNGQGEARRGQRQGMRHRRQKEAEALPQAHPEAQEHRRADQDFLGRVAAGAGCCRHPGNGPACSIVAVNLPDSAAGPNRFRPSIGHRRQAFAAQLAHGPAGADCRH